MKRRSTVIFASTLLVVSSFLLAICCNVAAAQDVDDETDEFAYEPVTVLDGRFKVPEWLVSFLSSHLGLHFDRVPSSSSSSSAYPIPPPDAPTLNLAPLHLPKRHSFDGRSLKRSSSPMSRKVVREGEWFVMVDKAYNDDFVGVLEEMGSLLESRFNMRGWFDVRGLRAARRAHEEENNKRSSEGEEEEKDEWKVDVREDEHGIAAIQLGKRMLVLFTISTEQLNQESDIIHALRTQPWTEFIEPHQVMRTHAPVVQSLNPDSSLYPWGLDRIDQRSLPLSSTYTYQSPTSGVTIYVLDTGIRITHQEFDTGRATWGTNTIDSTNDDCFGHGTHVAGIVAGVNVGVSKDAQVVAVKVLDCSGEGTALSVVQGLQYVVNQCTSPGTRCIASLSLGGDQISTTVDAAVQQAYNSGVLIVSAAGNSNIDACQSSPGRSPYGITVGATDTSDARAFFSNYGSCVGIFAPGFNIPSSYIGSDTTYAKLSGTSQATPHVTGSAAQFWGLSANAQTNVGQVIGAIYASATMNTLTNTNTDSPNRLLYSRVNSGSVPTTALTGCAPSGPFQCTTVQSTLTTISPTANVPSEQITIDATSARYGYFQAWLNSDNSDLDLRLQFYSTADTAWQTIATSAGDSGSEWLQFGTSVTGSGRYRFQIYSSELLGSNANFTFAYQSPNSAQLGTPKKAGAGTLRPFWLAPFY